MSNIFVCVSSNHGVKWLWASGPAEPFPFPAAQKGSAGPNFPPENTNSSSIKVLPAEPFVSGLNYPVGETFHLEPSLPLSLQMGPGCTVSSGKCIQWRRMKKVNIRQRSVEEVNPTSPKELHFQKAIQFLLGLCRLAYRGFPS